MVKGCVSNKASGKHFCSSENKWPTKAVLDRNEINMEELLILEFLIKQLFYLCLLDIEMIITNSALSASLVIYHFRSSASSQNN